jgi:uncharacterized phage protein gp47/JayE
MQLALQNFSTLVQNMAAAVQSSAAQLIDLTIGSTLRAVLEANASLALWLQWLILQVLQTTRAATSVGADLDSWMADFSLVRLPSSPAGGTVTFSRFTPLSSALVPVGALVRTADGTQTFTVTANPASTSFSSEQNGYIIPPGAASLQAPVVAVTPGTSGNVQAGAIALLATAIPGVDGVTNETALQNGIDGETDDAFRVRFRNFIASRSRATLLAVGYAISNIQQGLNYTIQENVDTAGNPRLGNFVVTVDDGSGDPSTSLLSTVSAAVDAVRPIGSTFSIQPPTTITASISLSISVAADADKPSIVGLVSAALTSFIDALAIGAVLPITRLAQVAYSAHPSVTNVTNLLVNGTSADIVASQSAVIKAGTIAID